LPSTHILAERERGAPTGSETPEKLVTVPWIMLSFSDGKCSIVPFLFLHLESQLFMSDHDGPLLCFVSGLKRMHALTIQANYELRIDLEDFENSTAFAQYGAFGVGLFSVDPDEDGYPLTIADYSGTAGNAIPYCTVAIYYGSYLSV
jgi:hypothetical protein